MRNSDLFYDSLEDDAPELGPRMRTSGNKERKYRHDYGGNPDHAGHQGFGIPWTGPAEPATGGQPLGLICDAAGSPLALDVNPAAFAKSHFATFPPKLVEPLIRAGTSERGCCAQCGAPWRRQTDTGYRNPGNRTTNGPRSLDQRHETAGFAVRLEKDTRTTGWSPGCAHDAAVVPCTVLDCFAGAGTTLLVADRLQRDAIGIELSAPYSSMATTRLVDDAPLLAWGAHQEAAE